MYLYDNNIIIPFIRISTCRSVDTYEHTPPICTVPALCSYRLWGQPNSAARWVIQLFIVQFVHKLVFQLII